jgi:lipopolysaccharide/colanic/teichoic acid biosynthesis glycosyltransferase
MMNSIFKSSRAVLPTPASDAPTLLPADLFMRTLTIERKRTERSGRSFVLMILDAEELLRSPNRPSLPKLIEALQSIRDTDIKGWHRDGAAIGVIFTEIGDAAEKSAVHTISNRVTDALYQSLTIEEINEIRLSFHVFPEDWDDDGSGPVSSTLRFAIAGEFGPRRASAHVKRLIDIAGSLAALVFFLPLMLAIALAIKMTSRGPVLFRQVRLGQHGRRFTFLKFRSMHVNNDQSIHKEYVTRFIAGRAEARATMRQTTVYKLTADPRVTSIGRFLRKTSLDELPQFLNVLLGEMSLVGPRPPVVYEVQQYSLWHRRRLLAVKPGITGLWQVEGRSRVTFDDMVRLDIRYARTWSLWLDLRILAQTPYAVLTGIGAC